VIFNLFRARYASGLIDFQKRKVSVALVRGYAPEPTDRNMDAVGEVLTTRELEGQAWKTLPLLDEDGEQIATKEVFTADDVIWPTPYPADGAVFFFADNGEVMLHKPLPAPPYFRLNFPNGILTLGGEE
jgi:hypothetical protein